MRKISISIVYKEFIDLFIDNFHISIINRIIIKLETHQIRKISRKMYIKL